MTTKLKAPPQKVNATDTKVMRFVLANLDSTKTFDSTPRQVADALRLRLRTVERAFPRLAGLGILVPEKRRDKRGHCLPTVYRVSVPVEPIEMPKGLARDIETAANPTATPILVVPAISDDVAVEVAVGKPTATPIHTTGDIPHVSHNTLTTVPIDIQTTKNSHIDQKTYVGVAVGSTRYTELDTLRQELAEVEENVVKFAGDMSRSMWETMVRDLKRRIAAKEGICKQS